MLKSLFMVALSTSMLITPIAAASNCQPRSVDVQQQSSEPEAQVDADPLLYKGVDWSSVIVEERDNGVIYKDNKGVVKPLENILVEAGINFVRQRVWTVDGDYGIDYNIKLAKRAWKAGLQFGLNLHFSDTWTNPEQQDIPSGWPTDIDGLEKRLWDYVTEVAETFYAEGLIPRTITIGNEIPTGLLWPTGHINNPENLSRLLHTAAQAVKQSSLGNTTKVMTHLAHGYNKELQNWFYDLVLAPGYFKLEDWDVIAVSFYPFWGEGATFAALTDSLTHLSTNFSKEVQVVETNWPVACPNPEYPFPTDQKDIPFTPAGQWAYLIRLADTLKAIPKATGLNYWESAWVNNAVLGSSCDYNVMFDPSGKAYDSLPVFNYL